MNLEELQRDWNDLGKEDPFWAVLSDPAKRGNKWNVEEFFKTGRDQIASTLAELEKLPRTLNRGAALDFGCGVGRLSQALAAHFSHVDGVDISQSMLDQARRFNAHGDRCQYHHNANANLRLFPEGRFDFVYSDIALQHMPAVFQSAYIREFIRVLKPGGLAVFQILEASFPRNLVPDRLAAIYRSLRGRARGTITMFGHRESAVVRLLQSAGAKVLKIDRMPTESARWRSLRFTAVRAD